MPLILLGTLFGAVTAGTLSSELPWIGVVLAVQLGACTGALIAALILYRR